MGRLLKRGAASPPVSELSKVFDARIAAERIVAQAQAEADRIRIQAQAEGREKGLAAVTELLVGARAAASRARATAAPELRVLAVRIAEKILGRALQLQPEVVLDVAAQALSAAGSARQVLVRCHPDDLAALERGKPRLLERASRSHALALRGDPSIVRGGCIVETELGSIDARLSTQLEAMERALRGEE